MFDTATGMFNLAANDPYEVPPGAYSFLIRGFYQDSTGQRSTSEGNARFVVTFEYPCLFWIEITAPTLENQDYTITQAAQYYHMPAFVASPASCGVFSYELVVTPSSAFSTITVD